MTTVTERKEKNKDFQRERSSGAGKCIEWREFKWSTLTVEGSLGEQSWLLHLAVGLCFLDLIENLTIR